MDEKGECLLKTLAKNCDYQKYKVFSEQDFCECLCLNCDGGKSAEMASEELRTYLKEFEEKGYIAVKYAFDGMYCVLALPRLKEYFCEEESKKVRLIERAAWERRFEKREFLFAFLGGFSGAATLGVLLAFLRILF